MVADSFYRSRGCKERGRFDRSKKVKNEDTNEEIRGGDRKLLAKKLKRQESEEEEGDLDELLAEEEINDSGAHDDYNWEVGNKSSAAYSQKEIDDYLEQYESTLTCC